MIVGSGIMDIDMFDNKIVIVDDLCKMKLLRKVNHLVNMKIITLSMLKKMYLFDYDYKAIYYVCSKYNCKPSIASKYIESMYYINDKYKSEKIDFLSKLKDELLSCGLLIKNELFVNFLKDKDIVLYNLKYMNLFYCNIIDEIKSCNNVIEYCDYKDKSLKKIYRAKDSNEEIAFVCSMICQLIKDGVPINKIKLANVSDNYLYVVKKMFKLFNIPINIKSNESIKSVLIVKKFKEYYDANINSTLSKVMEFVKNDDGYKIYKSIVNVVNKYAGSNYLDIKELLFYDLDKVNLDSVIYDNAVSIIDFKDCLIDSDDYVFLINFNEGVIPVCYKDEDYLSDLEKYNLGVDTSYMLNELSSKAVVDTILHTKNLIVTYSSYDSSGKLYVSSAYDKDIFMHSDVFINYNNSNNYNMIRLLGEMDIYNKYGAVSDDLLVLANHYPSYKYLDYSNKFKGIDKDKLNKYLNNKLTLSYTSMNTYYQCSFRYYLDYILKVNKYEDSFDTIVGNIFHEILSKCFKGNYDVLSNYDLLVSSSSYDFSSSEMFFLNVLRDEIVSLVDVILKQMKYTKLSKAMYEKEIVVNVSVDGNVKFKGFVDKILYDYFDGKMVSVIIDYKTGNPNININRSIYGLDMQLPIYVYLIKNEIKDVVIGGFYLQKILGSGNSLEDKMRNLKWQGYTNSDLQVINYVDSSYVDSKIIKSLRCKKDGFYSYAKVISDSSIDILYDIVDKKIKGASTSILSGEFDINPKEIDGDLVGCRYCKYRDICYMNMKDVVKLKDVHDIFNK